MAGQKSGSLADDLSHVEFITNEYVEVLPSFNTMNLREDLIRGMHSYGFKRPSPIQQRAIKPMIKGRDVIAQAQSGSGKTAMFLIAMLQSIDTDLKDTQVLCLSPTKELAEQIQKAVLVLGDYLNIQCHACVGGIDLGIDMLKLYFGQQIVSGTPDHVLDMLRHKAIRTHNIKTLVLDQADKILNKGFKKQIYDVYRFLPLGTQVILICTTLPYETLEVTNKLMTNPFIVLVKRNEPALKGIRQHFVGIGKEEWKFEMLCEFYNTLTPTQSVIFCNTKRKVDWLTKKMKEFNFPVNSVYGDMPIKERDAIIKEFRRSVPRMLVTTDIWSHGMDVQNALLVLNYDLPKNRELYIHRIGRCGQFGRKGVALSFVETHDDIIVRDKEQLYSVQIEEIPMNGADFI